MSARASTPARILDLDPAAYEAAIPRLAALLVDAVDGGASVNFLAGLTEVKAADWWTGRLGPVRAGLITPFVAFDAQDVVGCLLLIRSDKDNSPHRAEIGKVLVDRRARRRGIGRVLMLAAEERARADGRWLLVLNTVTGSPAEALYRSLGWHETGIVPDYAFLTDGQPAAATFFWKDLR